MTDLDPVDLAIQQLRAARSELQRQLGRVDSALVALTGNKPVEALGVLDRPNGQPVIPSATEVRPIIQMVLDLLDGERGPWKARDVERRLVEREGDIDSPDLYQTARTSLSILVQQGRAVRPGRGLYQGLRWAPENAEGPALTGPSDESHPPEEGGTDDDLGHHRGHPAVAD